MDATVAGCSLRSCANPRLWPDPQNSNIQFWYETKRALGTGSYGASEFGEVMWS